MQLAVSSDRELGLGLGLGYSHVPDATKKLRQAMHAARMATGSGIVRPPAEEESWLATWQRQATQRPGGWGARESNSKAPASRPGIPRSLAPEKTKRMGVYTASWNCSAGARSSSDHLDRHLLAGPVGMIGVTAARRVKRNFLFLRNLYSTVLHRQ